jgi:hypothetical protein
MYDAAGNNLIVVVGADERENGWIGEGLAEHAAISMSSKARGLSVVNTDLMSVGTREKMYSRGGIFSITSRILVVDLLTSMFTKHFFKMVVSNSPTQVSYIQSLSRVLSCFMLIGKHVLIWHASGSYRN